ncbi:MAG: hypothetical protein HEQ35_29470 [Gloeotrichia echinulata IR180]
MTPVPTKRLFQQTLLKSIIFGVSPMPDVEIVVNDIQTKIKIWQKRQIRNQKFSYAVSLIVILGGLTSSTLALLGGNNAKIWGGISGAVVVAAKAAGDTFGFTKKSATLKSMATQAEIIAMTLKESKAETLDDDKIQNCRNQFLSLVKMEADLGG